MTKQERDLRRMMEEHRVSQAEIAEYEEISVAAVSLRLKSLTPSMKQRFEDIILELSDNRSCKVAS